MALFRQYKNVVCYSNAGHIRVNTQKVDSYREMGETCKNYVLYKVHRPKLNSVYKGMVKRGQ